MIMLQSNKFAKLENLKTLEEDILDWRERIRWAYLFRNNRLKDDPNVDLSISPPFIKPPWYSRTDKIAPTASEEVELFIAMVRKSLLSPDIFSKYSSNISSLESKAFKELRNLKADGFSVFLQDKSSRFVIAKRELIEEKVDEDLNDSTKYIKLNEDDLDSILHQMVSLFLYFYKTMFDSILSSVPTFLIEGMSGS
jgi:hypothetical protein